LLDTARGWLDAGIFGVFFSLRSGLGSSVCCIRGRRRAGLIKVGLACGNRAHQFLESGGSFCRLHELADFAGKNHAKAEPGMSGMMAKFGTGAIRISDRLWRWTEFWRAQPGKS
jgi:hypothetical protein